MTFRRCGLWAAAVLVLGAASATYPAAQCAAFWLGRQDFAAATGRLAVDTGAVALAEGFRAAALRQGHDAGAIDSFIAAQRPLMARMFEAFVLDGDRASRDLHDSLLADCDRFAATDPALRALMRTP